MGIRAWGLMESVSSARLEGRVSLKLWFMLCATSGFFFPFKGQNREKCCLSGVLSWIQHCYLHSIHAMSASPPRSLCSFLTIAVNAAVIRLFMDDLNRMLPESRAFGLVWSFKTLAWHGAFLAAKLSWHFDWQECKRGGWEREALLFHLLRSLSSLLSSLSSCSLLTALQWWCGCDGGGVEGSLPSSSVNNRSLCIWPPL